MGKPRVETTTTYTNELIMTGCSDAYEEGVTPNAPYDAGAIQKAIQERNDRIKADANKPSNNTQSRPSAASSGRVANW